MGLDGILCLALCEMKSEESWLLWSEMVMKWNEMSLNEVTMKYAQDKTNK